MLPDSHIEAKFLLDGEKYDVEAFNISFSQPTDYKGQPQHEVRGGQMSITLAQAADDNLYLWAKTATSQKKGQVLFQTDMGKTVLRIDFINAYCVTLSRNINAFTGTKTSLVISAENVTVNDIEHQNFWKGNKS